MDRLPVRIGRRARAVAPEIDLTDWDDRHAVSRRHAVIERKGDTLFLRPESTINGTLLNGKGLSAGESVPLRDGDHITFGFGGVECVFHAGGPIPNMDPPPPTQAPEAGTANSGGPP
jgi:pSer/pThr/pTyr-binding forkhead associated (FHA) protein